MAALPPISEFTSAASELAYKTVVSEQRAFLVGLLGVDGTVATALATLGALGSGYIAKTAAYTLTISDRGQLIEASNTWALGLPSAASAGAGFSFALRNSGTGVITADPAGAETIDGAATLDFDPGSGTIIISTGTAWVTAGPEVQSSAIDTTAGRLLRVGAFGLGLDGVDGNDTPGDDLDALTIQGIWLYSNTTTSAPSTAGSVIHFNRKVGAIVGPYMQLAVSNRGELYTRYFDTGVWTAWVQSIQEGSAIGATTAAAGTFTDVALSGALTLNGNVTGGEQQTIANDAVGVFTPPPGFKGGWVRVTCRGDHDSPRAQASAELWWDGGISLAIYKNTGWTIVGSEVDILTTDVTGTTGAVGRLTIASQTGVMKVENRLGGPRSFQVRWG